jgi:hypothetical protein
MDGNSRFRRRIRFIRTTFRLEFKTRLTIRDVTKFTLQVETLSYFAGFYRGQCVPVAIYATQKGPRMENTGISNDQKSEHSGIVIDQFLSGNYVLMGYSIGWDSPKDFIKFSISARENGFLTVRVIFRRRFQLTWLQIRLIQITDKYNKSPWEFKQQIETDPYF